MLEISATGLENLTAIFQPPRTELITWRLNLILKLFGGQSWMNSATRSPLELLVQALVDRSLRTWLNWDETQRTRSEQLHTVWPYDSWTQVAEHILPSISCCKVVVLNKSCHWSVQFLRTHFRLIDIKITSADIFRELKRYGPVFHGLGHLIFKTHFEAWVGLINWFQWMSQYLWLRRRWLREKRNIHFAQSVALALTSRV